MKDDELIISAQENYRLRSQVSLAKVLESGEVARWWCTHIAECMPTAVIQSPRSTSNLPKTPIDAILNVKAETDLGTLSLRDFLTAPESGARGFLVIKGGSVVAENYPGMRTEDSHFLASCAKPAAGLMIEHLIDQGLLNDSHGVGDYLPSLRDTDWCNIAVGDVMDMTSGMDCAETEDAFADPFSITMRVLLAEFNEPSGGQTETLLEVLRASKQVSQPGERFEYGSAGTQVLVLLTEAVTGLPWAELFRDRVWAHLGAEAPFQVHLSPDGVALAHGLVSSRLRDLARFGMLFLPSWSCVSDQQVVSTEMMKRILNGTRQKSFFMNSDDGANYVDRLGDETMLGNARQWDCIWPNGDMFKSGFMGQGLYVSPEKDFVIAYFSAAPKAQLVRYLRPIASSGLLG